MYIDLALVGQVVTWLVAITPLVIGVLTFLNVRRNTAIAKDIKGEQGEIHVLVNSRLTTALSRILELEAALAGAVSNAQHAGDTAQASPGVASVTPPVTPPLSPPV